MIEKIYKTSCGDIHYWINNKAIHSEPSLIFLPGLTADHRLFDKQIEYFEGRYPVLVWDAPGHASSWPFRLDFRLEDKAKWLDEILTTMKAGTKVTVLEIKNDWMKIGDSEYFL